MFSNYSPHVLHRSCHHCLAQQTLLLSHLSLAGKPGVTEIWPADKASLSKVHKDITTLLHNHKFQTKTGTSHSLAFQAPGDQGTVEVNQKSHAWMSSNCIFHMVIINVGTSYKTLYTGNRHIGRNFLICICKMPKFTDRPITAVKQGFINHRVTRVKTKTSSALWYFWREAKNRKKLVSNVPYKARQDGRTSERLPNKYPHV